MTNRRLAALLPSRWIQENRLLPVRRDLRCIDWDQGLDRKPVASFEPPPPQYGPAVRRARAGAEPVNSGPAAFLGLISAFGH
jgi:hypothetical protein